ncbi:MAG: phospholipid carrier-dependent glycosyltransferase [Acidimicrobiales bacterium]|nr:phospholipid carrier-dependent glycosyltransferase [Acidimicrobiales bacterium]
MTPAAGAVAPPHSADPESLPPPLRAERTPTPPPVWWVVGFVVTGVLVSRGLWLDRPNGLVFDEVFYASDSLDLMTRGVERGSPSHPPMGKWMLTPGLALFGFTPWGWRIVPLLAGALVAGLAAWTGWRATDRVLGAVIAGLVVAVDGVAIVTGRLALLDGLVALWTTAALAILVVMVRAPLDRPLQRRLRWALAVVLGLAIATKWSAVLLFPVAGVVILTIDARLPAKLARRSVAGAALLLVVLPAAIYVGSHAGFFANYEHTAAARQACAAGDCGTGAFDRVQGFLAHHERVVDYHRDLEPSHSDVASSWSWLAQTNAVSVFEKRCTDGLAEFATDSDGVCSAGDGEAWVLVAGNPLLWVMGTAAVLALAYRALRHRDGLALLVVAIALGYWLPWAVSARAAYSFYGAPLVPVMGVALAVAVTAVPRRVQRWWPVLTLPAVLLSVALWPVWTGGHLGDGWYDRTVVQTVLTDAWTD